MKVVYKVIRSDMKCSFNMFPNANINKYHLYYNLNTIVKAVKGSLGIMCFETKEYAEKFINTHRSIKEDIDCPCPRCLIKMICDSPCLPFKKRPWVKDADDAE